MWSGESLRAFRPSQFVPRDEYDDTIQRDKEVNMATYTDRASAGLPLFDAGPAVQPQQLPRRDRA